MKKRTITKDFFIVITVVLFGKVLGFLREAVIASLYGSTVDTDAFYYVNGLITALFSVITMGLAQAFTPTYLDTDIKSGQKRSSRFADKIVFILLGVGLLVATVLLLLPGPVLRLFAPDMSDETVLLATKMLRIMAPCVPLYVLFSVRKSILDAHRKYFVTEASGIPYSIALSGLTYLLFRPIGSYALPVAALVGVFFQYLFTLVFSARNYRFSFPRYEKKDSEVRAYFAMLLPIALSAVLEEANGLLRKSLAGGMGEGTIANLNYCMTLTTLINGIFILSMSTVYFPHLIKNYSEGDRDEFKKNMTGCLSFASAIVIPVVMYCFLFSEDIVSVVYERGSFSHENTLAVASLFRIYVLGSIVYAYRTLIKNAFFATKDAKTPMLNEAVCLVICMVMNIVQVKVFRMGLEALGIGWVVSILLITPFLFTGFKKKHFSILKKSVFLETLKSVLSTAAVCALIILFRLWNPVSGAFLKLVITFAACFITYVGLMLLLKSTVVTGVFKAVFRKER